MAETEHPGDLIGGWPPKSAKEAVTRLSDEALKPGRGDLQTFTCLVIRLHNMYLAFENPLKEVIYLNAYAKIALPIIHKNRGLIEDVLIQDATKVSFGTPFYKPDHILPAVTTALELKEALEEFREVKTDIHIGIGINTGQAFLGNVGYYEVDDGRIQCGTYGDTIRTCYIIADSTKQSGFDILIGESTYLQVRKNIVASGPEEIILHPRPPLVVYRLEGLR